MTSGKALIKAIDAIAYKNNIQSVSNLPYAIRGYSAGGVFGKEFSESYPQKVACLVNIKGSAFSNIAQSEIKNVPTLLIIGELEEPGLKNMEALFLEKRKENALLCFAVEPNTGHGIGESDELAKDFITVALKKRISGDSNELILLEEESGILGDNTSKEFYEYAVYPEAKERASWLLNQQFAISWKDFQIE